MSKSTYNYEITQLEMSRETGSLTGNALHETAITSKNCITISVIDCHLSHESYRMYSC